MIKYKYKLCYSNNNNDDNHNYKIRIREILITKKYSNDLHFRIILNDNFCYEF